MVLMTLDSFMACLWLTNCNIIALVNVELFRMEFGRMKSRNADFDLTRMK